MPFLGGKTGFFLAEANDKEKKKKQKKKNKKNKSK